MVPLTLAVFITTGELREQVQQSLNDDQIRIVVTENDHFHWAQFLERIERVGADAVLLDIAQLTDSLEENIRSIKTIVPAAVVIALSNNSDGKLVMRAIRAGAAEFVCPPIAANLLIALERSSEEKLRIRNALREPGKIYGFVSAKGGSGATSIACHLAVELGRMSALKQQEVLLADLDLEGGMISFLMKSQSGYTVADALENVHRLDHRYWKGLVTNGRPGLEIITAPETFFDNSRPIGVQHIGNILDFARNHYAITIADLGRGTSPLFTQALSGLDELYMVTLFDLPALHRAKKMIAAALHMGYPKDRLRLIVNRVLSRTDVMPKELEKTFDIPVFASFPNDQAVLFDSYCEGKLAPPQSPFGKQISVVARKMTGAQETKRKFAFFGQG
jgi:pilus assembly protein CpaE